MYKPINTLQDGDIVNQIFLVSDATQKTTSREKPYALLTLRDVTGELVARIWDWDLSQNPIEPGYFNIRGSLSEFGGRVSLTTKSQNVTKCPNVPENIDDYIEGLPDQVIESLWEELISVIDTVENHFLRALLEFAFKNPESPYIEKLKIIPTGAKTRQSYKGGFLLHLTKVLKHVIYFCEVYAEDGIPFSQDLVISGALLHDLGKCASYEQEGHGWKSTDEDKLLGHLSVSFGYLLELFSSVESALGEEIPADMKLALQHIVLSHHGEFGEVPPKTVEAIILHVADFCDSRIATFLEQKKKSSPHSDWTDRIWQLRNIEIWTKDIL